jgi:hypothetical protein
MTECKEYRHYSHNVTLLQSASNGSPNVIFSKLLQLLEGNKRMNNLGEYYDLERNTVQSSISSPTFRKNKLQPSSELKSKPQGGFTCFLLGLISDPDPK